jgi:hypothetical protein
MAWLAVLDVRAARWPRVLRWPYLALRWFLLLIGIYLGFGLAFVELSEGRVGLGTGLALAMITAAIASLVDLRDRRRTSER